MPIVIALVVIIGLIGIANLSSLLNGSKKNAPASAMPMRPATPNAQQVNSFESQQQLQAQRDAEARQHQQELNAALQQLHPVGGGAGPGGRGLTADDRSAAFSDLWRQPKCAAAYFKYVAGSGRG
jgi:type IV secretion system protein VirB10